MFLNCGVEKTLESPLDCKEIKPVKPKGNQFWIFIGTTDAEAEIPILWLPDEMFWLIGNNTDAQKAWGQEEKGTTEDEMAEWHAYSVDMSLMSSRSQWWARKPGMLQSMELQRITHDWAIELNWFIF